MNFQNFFTRSAVFFALYPKRLLGGLFFLLCGALWILAHTPLQEDIATMLPEDSAADVELLAYMPFSRTVFLHFTVQSGAEPRDLLRAAQKVRENLDSPYVTKVLPGENPLPDPLQCLDFFPSLFSNSLQVHALSCITEEAVAQRMQRNYAQLTSFSGLLFKPFIQADPLGFLTPLFTSLRGAFFFSGTEIQDGVLLSADGQHALLLARTDIPPTDSSRGALLLADIEKTLTQSVVPHISVELFSSHAYALENARTVKADLRVILSVASCVLLGIFLVAFPWRNAVLIALFPGLVLVLAGAGTALLQRGLSGITLGFGSVILGISVDFAIHVACALEGSSGRPAKALERIVRPLLFGGGTSLGAFAVLACAPTSGLRQLALFAVIGLLLAMVLALCVLPHLLRSANLSTAVYREVMPASRRWNLPVAAFFALCLITAFILGSRVPVSRDLRAMNIASPHLQKIETSIRQHFGAAREQAVFFSRGQTVSAALTQSEYLQHVLRSYAPELRTVSLHALLPAREIQDENQKRWRDFVQSYGAMLQKNLYTQSQLYGFSAQAFAPFLRALHKPPVYAESTRLRQAGFGPLLEILLARNGPETLALTLVPDTAMVQAFADGPSLPAGVRFVSEKRLGDLLGRTLTREFRFFVGASFLIMGIFLAVFFRRLALVLLAMLPLATGLGGFLVVLFFWGKPLTLFSVASLPLLIGLAADYGIFMVCACQGKRTNGTRKAVFVSGLTTLVGFGALALAKHPALHSMGITVVFGIGMAIPAALWGIPLVYSEQKHAGSSREPAVMKSRL